MPLGALPPIRWTLDGDDITELVEGATVSWGSNARTAQGLPILLASARGQLNVLDRDRTLLANAGGRAECFVGGHLAWSGRAQRIDPFTLYLGDSSAGQRAIFRLTGRWAHYLSSPAEVHARDLAHVTDIADAMRAATGLSSVWQGSTTDISDEPGADLIDIRPPTTWAEAWSTVALAAGGFAVENHIGQIMIARFDPEAIAAAIPLPAALSPAEGSVFAPRPTMACTGIDVVATAAVADSADAGNLPESHFDLGDVPVSIVARTPGALTGTATVEWRSRSPGGVMSWLPPAVPSGVTATLSESTASWARWEVSGPIGDHTVTVRGQVLWRVGRDIRTIDQTDTAGADGRSMGHLRWGNAPLPILPKAALLAQSLKFPPQWLHAIYPLAGERNVERLLSVTPGQVVAPDLGGIGRNALTLDCTLSHGYGNIPTLEIVGMSPGVLGGSPKPPDPAPTPPAPMLACAPSGSKFAITVPLEVRDGFQSRVRWLRLTGADPLTLLGAWSTSVWLHPTMTEFVTPQISEGEYVVQVQLRHISSGVAGTWSNVGETECAASEPVAERDRITDDVQYREISARFHRFLVRSTHFRWANTAPAVGVIDIYVYRATFTPYVWVNRGDRVWVNCYDDLAGKKTDAGTPTNSYAPVTMRVSSVALLPADYCDSPIKNIQLAFGDTPGAARSATKHTIPLAAGSAIQARGDVMQFSEWAQGDMPAGLTDASYVAVFGGKYRIRG